MEVAMETYDDDYELASEASIGHGGHGVLTV